MNTEKDKTKGTFVQQQAQDTAGAFSKMVCEHQKAVFAVAYAKLRNKHDAEDITQDVFVEAYQNMRKLENPRGVSTWLYKAAIYRCKDHLRRMSRRERREAIFLESVPANPGNPQSEGDRHGAVVKAIALLPEEIRIVVMLRHLAQLSYADISKMTGLSKTTIDGRLRTGKKQLRQKLIDMGIGVD